jgi:hypothetical protein
MPRHQKPVKIPGFQGLDKAVLFLLVLGLSLICLPSWAQEEEEGVFKGVGIHLRLRGGWAMFAGGDLEAGTSGRYDRILGELSALGLEISRQAKKPFRSGYEMGGDVVYFFTPSLGAGLGGSLLGAHTESSIMFNWPGSPLDYSMTSVPELKVWSLRLGLFLSLPLNRLLTFCASAGPALYFSEFRYTGDAIVMGNEDSLHQEVKASQWGVQGSLGLEVRMNRRLAFILEAQGRYAKISGFEGTERTFGWHGGQSQTVNEDGTLYFIEGEDYPRLDVIPGQPDSALQARKAVLDLSGLSLTAGFNFKF